MSNPTVRDLIANFVDLVCKRAELKMLRTGKLEGAHYAAMKELLVEMNPDGTLPEASDELT